MDVIMKRFTWRDFGEFPQPAYKGFYRPATVLNRWVGRFGFDFYVQGLRHGRG